MALPAIATRSTSADGGLCASNGTESAIGALLNRTGEIVPVIPDTALSGNPSETATAAVAALVATNAVWLTVGTRATAGATPIDAMNVRLRMLLALHLESAGERRRAQSAGADVEREQRARIGLISQLLRGAVQGGRRDIQHVEILSAEFAAGRDVAR